MQHLTRHFCQRNILKNGFRDVNRGEERPKRSESRSSLSLTFVKISVRRPRKLREEKRNKVCSGPSAQTRKTQREKTCRRCSRRRYDLHHNASKESFGKFSWHQSSRRLLQSAWDATEKNEPGELFAKQSKQEKNCTFTRGFSTKHPNQNSNHDQGTNV